MVGGVQFWSAAGYSYPRAIDWLQVGNEVAFLGQPEYWVGILMSRSSLHVAHTAAHRRRSPHMSSGTHDFLVFQMFAALWLFGGVALFVHFCSQALPDVTSSIWSSLALWLYTSYGLFFLALSPGPSTLGALRYCGSADLFHLMGSALPHFGSFALWLSPRALALSLFSHPQSNR